jgi:hypothetical protein
MAVHSASRRVMEKAGLRFVRTFVADWPVRIEGDEHGDVEYALTFQEWASARPGMIEAAGSGRLPPAGARVGTPEGRAGDG